MSFSWGLIGAGRIAHAYVQALAMCQDAQIVAIADNRPEAARELSQAVGCPSYESYHEMSESASLDAVMICTPPVSHEEIACYFLQRSVPVLCEKPLSTSIRGARAILETAKQAGGTLMMGAKFHYVEDIITAKRLAAFGLLGDIVRCDLTFASYVDMAERWNSDVSMSGGGVLMDNGPHAFDLMRYLLGPLEAVKVEEGKRLQGLAVEESVGIDIRSMKGQLGHIKLSWSEPAETDTYLTLSGTQGTIEVGWRTSGYRLLAASERIEFGTGYSKIRALQRQVENMSAAVLGTSRLRTTCADAMASVEAVAAGYRALAEQHWVVLESALSPTAPLSVPKVSNGIATAV